MTISRGRTRLKVTAARAMRPQFVMATPPDYEIMPGIAMNKHEAEGQDPYSVEELNREPGSREIADRLFTASFYSFSLSLSFPIVRGDERGLFSRAYKWRFTPAPPRGCW